MKRLNKEDMRVLPLAVIGLGLGVANVFIKPAIEESAVKLVGFVLKHSGATVPEIDFDELNAAIEAEGAKYGIPS